MGDSYWAGVASRVNIPGVILLIIGMIVCFGAKKLSPLLFKNPKKMALPMKFTGLLLAIVGALITIL